MLVESKFFLQFVEKMEKLKLLSKQHNKMLKINSEMLKIRKNVKIIELEKNFPRKFPESREFKDFRNSGNFQEVFGKFPVSG